MTSPAEILDETDLTEAEYSSLEAIASEAGKIDQRSFFRARLRRVALFLIVRNELRKGAAGGQYVDLARYYRDQVDTLEKACKIAGSDSTVGSGLTALITDKRATLDMLESLPREAKSKPEIAQAVAMLVEIFAHHTGQAVDKMSPGSRGEDYANSLCRFVRKALAIMGVNLSHDRVWQLVDGL